MRYILFVLLIFYGTLTVAQRQNNIFDNSEYAENTANQVVPGGGPGTDDEGGDLEGPDPVPIDDYIPLLIITALGLIIYNTHTRKKNATRFS